MSDITQTQQPEKELHFLTVREVQAIKSLLEKEIREEEEFLSAMKQCAKEKTEEILRNEFYSDVKYRKKRIAKLASVQRSVKKFLTDPHV